MKNKTDGKNKKDEQISKEKSEKKNVPVDKSRIITESNDKNIKKIDQEQKIIKDIQTQTGLANTENAETMKDPLYSLNKDQLVSKIKELEESVKQAKEEKKKSVEKFNQEMDVKEKIIVQVSSTNKKLMAELEYLKKEVDDKLDKIGMKEIRIKEKEIERQKKDKPLEQVLKVKEKELKNSLKMLEIYKKDKDNLEKIYKESDVSKLIDLEEKLKIEVSKNNELKNEIKSFNKINEEHKKCDLQKEELLNEKKRLGTEIKYLKEKHKELMYRIREEEEKQAKMNDGITKLRSSGNTLPNINQNNPKTIKLIESKRHSDRLSMTYDNKSPQKLAEQKKKFSESLQNKNFQMENNEKAILFTKENREALLNILGQEEVNKLEKKFDSIERTKFNLEKKNKSDNKQLNRKIEDLEERLEFTQLQYKECEQKSKIMSYQINEFKLENKILNKNIRDIQTSNDRLNNNILNKEEENKRLIMQLQEYQKRNDNSKDLIDTDNMDYELNNEDD
jgi:hypothetical protein